MIQKVAFNSNFVKKCRKPISAPNVKSANIFTRRRKPMVRSMGIIKDFLSMVIIIAMVVIWMMAMGGAF